MKQVYRCLVLAMTLVVFVGCSTIEKIASYNLDAIGPRERVEEVEKQLPESTYVKEGLTFGAVTPQSMHPYAVTEYTIKQLLWLSYDSLFRVTTNLAVEEQLVSDYEVDSVDRKVTLVLKDKVFHDGSPVTAGDVVYSYQLASRDRSFYREITQGIDSLDQVDENKLEVTFKPSASFWLQQLVFPIVKKDSLEEDPWQVNGSGDYKTKSFQAYDHWELVHQESGDIIKVLLMRNSAYLKTAYDHHRLDVYFNDPFDGGEFSEGAAESVFTYLSNAFYYIGYNGRQDGLINQANALYYSLDLASINEAVFLGQLTYKFLPGQMNQTMEKKIYDEKKRQFDLSYQPSQNKQVYQGIYLQDQDWQEDLVKELNKQWEEVIQVQWTGLDQAGYLQALEKGQFDFYIAKAKLAYLPKVSDFLGVDGALNYGQTLTNPGQILLSQWERSNNNLKNYQDLLNHTFKTPPLLGLGIKNYSVLYHGQSLDHNKAHYLQLFN